MNNQRLSRICNLFIHGVQQYHVFVEYTVLENSHFTCEEVEDLCSYLPEDMGAMESLHW